MWSRFIDVGVSHFVKCATTSLLSPLYSSPSVSCHRDFPSISPPRISPSPRSCLFFFLGIILATRRFRCVLRLDDGTTYRKRCGLGGACRRRAGSSPAIFGTAKHTPGRLARSKRASRHHSCIYRDYIARSPRKASQEDMRRRERKRSTRDGSVRSLKPGRPVYCMIRDAGEKDCNGFS